MNWFFDLKSDKVVEYLVCFIVKSKTLFTNFVLILVPKVFHLSPRMLSNRLWPR